MTSADWPATWEAAMNKTYPGCCSSMSAGFLPDAVDRGQPQVSFGVEAGVMIGLWVLIIVGGLLNLYAPSACGPRGCCSGFFYKRLGTSAFLRYTTSELVCVFLVLGFYATRFILFYRTYEPYETSLESVYPGSSGAARAAAHALMEVFYSSLPVQVSLGTKNNFFWFSFTGMPMERAVAYHAAHGYASVVIAIAAWVFFAIGGLTTRTFSSDLCMCDTNPVAGVVSVVCLCLLVLMSSAPIRRKNWEAFYLMGHFSLIFPMFWATIIYDRVQIFPWAVLTLAQWGGSDLPLRFFQKVMQPPKVLKVEVDKDSRITKLTLSKAYDGSKTKQTLGTFSSRWEAGSYVWLAVRMPNANPLVGKVPTPFNKPWACYHPISISNSPIDETGAPSKSITLHIKSMGEGTWSQALLDYAMDMVENEKSPETMKAWLGGPLGRLSINPQHCDRIVLCAGGIGCTPMVALAMDQHFRSLNKATSVQVPRVELVWAERSMKSFSIWKPELEILATSKIVTVKLFCTNSVKKNDSASVEMQALPADSMTTHGNLVASGGRPNFPAILKSARDSVMGGSGQQRVVGVYACGPGSLMQAVREAAQVASANGINFYLHTESYEL